MLAAWASCANKYAKKKKEKNMMFSVKYHGALLRYTIQCKMATGKTLANLQIWSNLPKFYLPKFISLHFG